LPTNLTAVRISRPVDERRKGVKQKARSNIFFKTNSATTKTKSSPQFDAKKTKLDENG
jgi:hypothetical protein